jgi:hypothetical protein
VVALAAVVGGCNDLAVENPNAPDAKRALADPDAVEALGAGAMRTWFDAWTHLSAAGVLSVQARTFSASWNNANMNFYSSIDNPTAHQRLEPDVEIVAERSISCRTDERRGVLERSV